MSASKPRGRAATSVATPGLRRAMERAGVAPAALAAAMGRRYSRTQVANWASRQAVPSAHLSTLARALGVEVAELEQAPEGDDTAVVLAELAVEVETARTALNRVAERLRRFS